jgi:hypothetical protein
MRDGAGYHPGLAYMPIFYISLPCCYSNQSSSFPKMAAALQQSGLAVPSCRTACARPMAICRWPAAASRASGLPAPRSALLSAQHSSCRHTRSVQAASMGPGAKAALLARHLLSASPPLGRPLPRPRCRSDTAPAFPASIASRTPAPPPLSLDLCIHPHPTPNHSAVGAGVSPELKVAIDKYITENRVVVFMKGTKQFPQCGFSNTVVQVRAQRRPAAAPPQGSRSARRSRDARPSGTTRPALAFRPPAPHSRGDAPGRDPAAQPQGAARGPRLGSPHTHPPSPAPAPALCPCPPCRS